MHAQLQLRIAFELARGGDGVSDSQRASEPVELKRDLGMPAQRLAEVLGTLSHAQLVTCIAFLGIGSGHRQLIAVTCIAEHA